VYTYDDFTWVCPAELGKMAQCTTPWEWYLATKVHIYTSELIGIVCPVESDGEDDPPLGPLHVITAVQPRSEPDSDENIARIGVLDRELRAAGISSVRAVGTSLDGKHREESRAVFGLDDAQARGIGRRFGQVAIFSWTGPRWSLLASAGDRQTHRLWRWDVGP
jgi:hypothetical protein